MATAQRGNKRAKKEDEVSRLERELRELKSINRSLMKQLKKLSKGIHREEYEEALEVKSAKRKEEPKERECPSCARAGLKEVIVAGRVFRSCTICDYRSGRVDRK